MSAPSRTVAARLGGLPRPRLSGAASPKCRARRQWHSTAPSSVNPDEVSHFDALASDWWDPHGTSRPLHLMNPLRHDFIRACHASEPRQAGGAAADATADAGPPLGSSYSYLDVGCGGGIFAESAARLPTTRHVTGIDPTPSVVAAARAHARKDPSLRGRLEYRQAAIEELAQPRDDADGYDVVSLFEVIEHVDAPAAFLQRLQRFVKPGGWLVMSTVARTWTSWLTTKVVAEDVLRVIPRGTHDWNKYINEHELRHFFAGPGWESPRVMGVVYLPGLGWRVVPGSEKVGNYFFGVRRAAGGGPA